MTKNPLLRFISTTAIGGAVFLVPVLFLGYVLLQAVGLMVQVAEPFTRFIPIDRFAGVAVVNVLAVLLIVLICFLAGLVARHAIADSVVTKLDELLLKVPGYSMIRGIKSGFDADASGTMKPVALKLGAAECFGFEMQKLSDDRSMVYVPTAPNPWSGITLLMRPGQITYLDVPVTRILELAEKYGHGVEELLSVAQPGATKSPLER